MGKPTSRVTEVRIRGPLATIAEEFRTSLLAAGYTPLTSVNKLRAAGYLSQWLATNDLGLCDLTEERIQEYLRTRRAKGHTWEISRLALVPLLDLLAGRSMLPSPASSRPPDGGVDVVLAQFQRYLLQERGLVLSTADAYVFRARRFLQRQAPDGDVRLLTATDVLDAIRAESAAVSVAATQYFVVAVRAFLRFCHMEGLTDADLSAAALSITGRRHAPLPRGITRSDAGALLQSCDRRTAVGQRDHAVLTTLLRLGLRATELADLTLEDIDWRAAEIEVHGKGRRDERLPLPADVGEAIVGYLRKARPKTHLREVFLSTIAPVHRLGRGAVSSIVRRACGRAGVAPVGAHRLRHTLACEMVSAGVPLPEIGQVLRHRGLTTTVVYARVGVAQLRTLAQPWPGEAER